MGSRRLPGKVLMKLNGIPVLERVYRRCALATSVKRIVVLTSQEPEDDQLVDFCENKSFEVMRGSLEDLVSRYWVAAKSYDLPGFLRVTADCPLLEPSILDCVNIAGVNNSYDYFGLSGNFPDGLDCTYFSRYAINTVHKNAKLASEREHVGPYIEANRSQFKTGELELFYHHSHYRLTLDCEQDFVFLDTLLNKLEGPKKNIVSINEVIEFLQRNKQLMDINKGIVRNEGYLASIRNDYHVKF
jgi:spore coat polysaccharide biosynthesis protein SpsF (cytidylyltransferase family)